MGLEEEKKKSRAMNAGVFWEVGVRANFSCGRERENFLLRTSQPNGSCEEAFSDSAFPFLVWEAPEL